MSIRLSTAAANALLGAASPNSLKNIFLNGVLLLYSGPQPTSADNAPNGSLLGTITLNGGAFTPGNPTNGLQLGQPPGWTAGQRIIGIPSGAIWSCLATGNGTIQSARLVGNAVDGQANDTTFVFPRIDFAVGVTSGDLLLPVVNVTVGLSVAITNVQLSF